MGLNREMWPVESSPDLSSPIVCELNREMSPVESSPDLSSPTVCEVRDEMRSLVLDDREEVPGVDRDELSGVSRVPVSPQRTEERSSVLSPQGPDGMSRGGHMSTVLLLGINFFWIGIEII